MKAGSRNDITDVPGVAVGHHHRRGRGWLTGTTVVIPPPGTVGGVDVRGGGPGTREIDTMNPVNLVHRVDAVCLSGGSAYGLAAASGVADWLGAKGLGFPVGPRPEHVVPIVPAAVLFDLGIGAFEHRPDREFGWRAASSARRSTVRQGTVGAGTGAHAGGLKGGIGSASVVLDDGTTVAALVALNSGGSPVDDRSGELWGARYGVPGEFAALRTPTARDVEAFRRDPPRRPPLNTTLAVIATDATLDVSECTRLAGAGHDGMARAVRPIHTYTDGDTVFALATGARDVAGGEGMVRAIGTSRHAALAELFTAGADCVTRAIVHAVLSATSAGGLVSYRERFPSAIRPR